MFKLNLKIALRNLWRHKTSSFINITGLAIGLSACLMLLFYVSYEWNFDKQAKDSGRVYQTMTNVMENSGDILFTFNGTTTALGPLLKQQLPELESVCRLGYGRIKLIANGQNSFKKTSVFAEPAIFDMYDYQFISGSPATAMSAPRSVVLTESMARILFGTADVTGKAVRYEDQEELTVTGVIRDLPENSSNRFDFLMPWSLYEILDPGARDLNWDDFSYMTLVKLRAGASADLVNKRLGPMLKKYNDADQQHFLYPLGKLHLYGTFVNGKSAGGAIEQIRLFVILAGGILLIACINFMNMATAKSERRAKEVSVKKTIGANRLSLIMQFLTESMVLAAISIVIAIALIELFLPIFNNLLSIQMEIGYFSVKIWMVIIGLVLLTGLIAGSYPAFYLSSFDPVGGLRKNIARGGFLSVSLRQVLVTGQFCFTVMLFISTIVIYKQIQYIKNRPIGADVSALVQIPQDGALLQKYEVYKTALLRSGAVTSVTHASSPLSHHGSNFMEISWPGMNKPANDVLFNQVHAGYDYVKTTGIKVISGRDFSKQLASDTASVLISASAAKVMNLENPVGTQVKVFDDRLTIVGVFNDYIWDSPDRSNAPMVIRLDDKLPGVVTMRLNPDRNLQASVDAITTITKDINPAYPVELTFLSSVYADLQKAEKILGTLSNLFGGLAIFISCLGLFGLVTYSAEQRTKEFGVRKVLGASVFSMMRLLSLSFIKMILVAICIAVPAAWMLMNRWLQQYEFHTAISWWVIGIAIVGTLLTAMLTVSLQAYKTATANPVDALKYE